MYELTDVNEDEVVATADKVDDVWVVSYSESTFTFATPTEAVQLLVHIAFADDLTVWEIKADDGVER